MSEPLILLIVVILLTVIIVLAVRYKYVIKNRLKKFSSEAERILIEDALKHFYDYEYKRQIPTVDSLAGNLNISNGKAAKLVNRLNELGLLKVNGERLELTPNGRSYALKVIRIHRLWERYLAEETSVPVEDWHRDAELREHKLTDDEVENLSEKLGNPVYDPHGDPIPDKYGVLPDFSGVELHNLNVGDYGIITHIEDEPKEVYQQISALGLRRGMQLRILEKDNVKISFDAEGEEIKLAIPFTKNITVKKLEDKNEILEDFETLDSLDINEEAEVVGISNALIGQQRRRLLDLGIVPGSKIKAVLSGIGNDPVAYVVKDTTIALRKAISKWIYIRKEMKDAA